MKINFYPEISTIRTTMHLKLKKGGKLKLFILISVDPNGRRGLYEAWSPTTHDTPWGKQTEVFVKF